MTRSPNTVLTPLVDIKTALKLVLGVFGVFLLVAASCGSDEETADDLIPNNPTASPVGESGKPTGTIEREIYVSIFELKVELQPNQWASTLDDSVAGPIADGLPAQCSDGALDTEQSEAATSTLVLATIACIESNRIDAETGLAALQGIDASNVPDPMVPVLRRAELDLAIEVAIANNSPATFTQAAVLLVETNFDQLLSRADATAYDRLIAVGLNQTALTALATEVDMDELSAAAKQNVASLVLANASSVTEISEATALRGLLHQDPSMVGEFDRALPPDVAGQLGSVENDD